MYLAIVSFGFYLHYVDVPGYDHHAFTNCSASMVETKAWQFQRTSNLLTSTLKKDQTVLGSSQVTPRATTITPLADLLGNSFSTKRVYNEGLLGSQIVVHHLDIVEEGNSAPAPVEDTADHDGPGTAEYPVVDPQSPVHLLTLFKAPYKNCLGHLDGSGSILHCAFIGYRLEVSTCCLSLPVQPAICEFMSSEQARKRIFPQVSKLGVLDKSNYQNLSKTDGALHALKRTISPSLSINHHNGLQVRNNTDIERGLSKSGYIFTDERASMQGNMS
uniref:Uncharacterized protein n=1 Tax=Timema genevievae TaxID=629358 RepID=A0A7R9PGP6_TIMGE|nr:unnamed protein product [Timema genevievae]